MNNESYHRDRVEWLASEFVDALRAGQQPNIEQYANEHPEHAAEIRDLFPTIVAMERLKTDQAPQSTPRLGTDGTDIERLGDLRIIREIGRGGMGIVYEAEQESLGRRVAVKVLPKHQLNSKKSLARFLRESKTAAKLHHTNIVSVLGVGADDGYHYYVMQYIRGVGLDEVIAHLGGGDSPISRLSSAKRPANLSAVASALLEPSASDHGSSHRAARIDETLTSTGALDDTDLSLNDIPVGTLPSLPTKTAPNPPFANQYWRSVAKIGYDVASALEYAHEHGTLHRDIKPSNLLIDADGEISVADFGLAKSIGQEDLSRTGDIVGTLRYMAPEQFTGHADQRSDVYSLGVTLYELVTLQPAYNESERAKTLIHGNAILPARPRHVRRDIPSDLETIILKAINIEPQRRYQTAGELASDLRCYCEDRPIQARRTSPIERMWRWSRRNPAIASLCAVAVSLLVAIAAISTVASYKTTQAKDAAERTSQHAFEALDRIFDRLAPLPTVGVEAFAEESTDETSSAIGRSQPVLTHQSAALLDEMLIFYDKLAAEGTADDQYRERLADANRRIGDIRQRLGQFDLAEAAYRKALEIYIEIDVANPSPSVTARIAAIHNAIGKSLRGATPSRQRMFESAAEFEIARELLEPISGPGSAPEIRYELANTYYLQAEKHPIYRGGPGRGRPGRGGPHHGGPHPGGPDPGGPHHGGPDRDGSDPGGPDRDGSDPGGPDRDGSDPGGPDRDGSDPGGPDRGGPDGDWPDRHPHDLDGREPPPPEGFRPPPRGPDPAEHPQEPHPAIDPLLAKAITLLERLVAQYPDRPDYQRLLAMSYLESTKSREMAHSPDGKHLRSEAIEVLSGLVEQYPGNPDYRFALSAAYAIGRPDIRAMAGERSSEYLDRLEKAETLLTELRRDHPSVPEYLDAQMKLFLHIGLVHKVNDRADQALEVYRRAVKLGQSSSPDALTPATVMAISEVYFRMVELLQRLSDADPNNREALLAEAQTQLQENVYLFEQLSGSPTDIIGWMTWARVYRQLAEVATALGDEPGARSATEKMRQKRIEAIQDAKLRNLPSPQ